MIQSLWTFAKGLPWWAGVLVGLAVLFRVASPSIASPSLLLLISMVWPRDLRSEDTPLLRFPGSDIQLLL